MLCRRSRRSLNLPSDAAFARPSTGRTRCAGSPDPHQRPRQPGLRHRVRRPATIWRSRCSPRRGSPRPARPRWCSRQLAPSPDQLLQRHIDQIRRVVLACTALRIASSAIFRTPAPSSGPHPLADKQPIRFADQTTARSRSTSPPSRAPLRAHHHRGTSSTLGVPQPLVGLPPRPPRQRMLLILRLGPRHSTSASVGANASASSRPAPPGEPRIPDPIDRGHAQPASTASKTTTTLAGTLRPAAPFWRIRPLPGTATTLTCPDKES